MSVADAREVIREALVECAIRIDTALSTLESVAVVPAPIDPPAPPPAPGVGPVAPPAPPLTLVGGAGWVEVSWPGELSGEVNFGWDNNWQGKSMNPGGVRSPWTIRAGIDGPVPDDTEVSVDVVFPGAMATGSVRTLAAIPGKKPVVPDPPAEPPASGEPARASDTGAAPAHLLQRVAARDGLEIRDGHFGPEVWITKPIVVTDLHIPYPVIWAGHGALLMRNCRIDVTTKHHNGFLSMRGAGRATLEHCTVTRSTQAATYGNGAVQTSAGEDVQMSFCDLSGFGDGFQGGQVRAVSCWLHDNFIVPGVTHNDGLQVWTNASIINCRVELPADPSGRSANAGLMMMAGCRATVVGSYFSGGGCGINKAQGGTLDERDNAWGTFKFGPVVG